ncbi:MAG: MFS transporter [Legionella sp.]|nr:MAG: MFS transporter [Legionella sp.]
MKQSWLGNTFRIAAIFAFRMLGLFMLIPVFTVYAHDLQGATPLLLGIALGAYGLTQGLLQLPFGILSDRYGRKPLITLGLILFALGSLLGAWADTISGMILARTLQGAGAIGSVLIALLADVTTETHRTKAMAIIGATIGLSFTLALVLSPTITEFSGLSGIFYLTAALAVIGLLILHSMPTPSHTASGGNDTINIHQLKQVFLNRDLLRLDAGIFFQHLILISTFYALPILLQHHIRAHQLAQSWQFYLPVMLISFLLMIPVMLWTEKNQKTKALFVGSVATILVTQFGLALCSTSFIMLCGLMFAYFVAFNLLEANLPSLISKQVNPNAKGCAMGVYSSSQFLGIFVGGSLAGMVFQYAGSTGIFVFNTCITVLWFGMTLFLNINARHH